MKCSHARGKFSSCLDRDLTFQEEGDLRQHLEDCPGCAEEMRRLERVQGLLRGLPETDPGPGFYERVRARIAAAGPNLQPDPVRPPFSLSVWLGRLLSPMWLRPAAGMALGLAAGLLIGIGAVGNAPFNADLRATDVAHLGDLDQPTSTVDAGPLVDIELPPFAALSDSVRVVGEEYILDTYVNDSDGGLVPAGSGSFRRVSGSGHGQGDGYITF